MRNPDHGRPVNHSNFNLSVMIAPGEWFEDVIRRIPEYDNGGSDVTRLLPKNWKANWKDFNQR